MFLKKYVLVSFMFFSSICGATGTVSIAGLPASSVEDKPVCYDQASGRLGKCAVVVEPYLERIAWVAQDGTGDYTSPVTALATGSLNDWCPNRNSDQHCLLRIAPGRYDLGTGTLRMKNYIDIEGSGRDTTLIVGERSDYGFNTGLVEGANAAIRSLSLRAVLGSGTGSVTAASAIYNDSTGFEVENVSIFTFGNQARGGVRYGINNRGGSITIRDSSVQASQGDSVRSVYVRNSNATIETTNLYANSGTTSVRSILTSNDAASTNPSVTVTRSLLGADVSVGSSTSVKIKLSDMGTSVVTGSGTANCRAIVTTISFKTVTCP